MSTLSCPRCELRLASGRPDEDEVVVHVCERCNGLWVDGEDVAWIYPALRDHGRRIDQLLAHGARRDTAIAICPRGHGAAIEFPFFDLWLDLCETCHGLWLDGSEVAFVRRAAGDSDGLPQLDRRGAYRESLSPEAPRVTCSACSKAVHPRRTFLTADGAVCDDCAEVSRLASQIDADSALSRLRRAPGRVLRFIGDLLDADGKRLRRGGFTNQLR